MKREVFGLSGWEGGISLRLFSCRPVGRLSVMGLTGSNRLQKHLNTILIQIKSTETS